MPPRSHYVKSMQPTPEECTRTIADWRRILSGTAAPPSAPVDPLAAMAAPSSSSASGSLPVAVNPLKREALRKDMPIIKNARRGGTAQAIVATQSVGLQSLIDNLHRDREAASGIGATNSHLATWTTFHHKVYGSPGDVTWAPVLPLVPD